MSVKNQFEKNIQTVLFRVDANTEIGTGHFMRCLALIQAAQEQGLETHVLTHLDFPEALKKRALLEGVKIHFSSLKPGTFEDAVYTVNYALKRGINWLVCDGYHFSEAYQNQLRKHPLRTLILDDNHEQSGYACDILLNQNIHSNTINYVLLNPDTRLLLGSKYALIRKEFLAFQPLHAEARLKPHVLISLGGSDIENVTLKLLQAIESTGLDLDLTVLLGATNKHLVLLNTWLSDSGLQVKLIQNSSQMAALMASSDLAITAGGSTCWESVYMGLPAIIWVLAENQKQIADSISKAGAASCMGWYTDEKLRDFQRLLHQWLSHLPLQDNQAYNQCVSACHDLIDGQGAQRVIQEILSFQETV